MSARVRIGWAVYSTVLTVAVVLGEASNLRGGPPEAITLANWVLTISLLTALWAYTLRRKLGTSTYWRAAFWIVLFANAVMLVPVMLAGGAVAVATGVLTLLIVPAYIAAFRYAYRSSELWTG